MRVHFLAAAIACAVLGTGCGTAFADSGGGGGHGSGGGASGSGSSGGSNPASGSSDSGNSDNGSTGKPDGASSLSQREQALVRKAVEDGNARSLGEIMPVLRKTAPGRILNISFGQSDGDYVYVFTVLTSAGRIFDVSVDAKTGAQLSAKGR